MFNKNNKEKVDITERKEDRFKRIASKRVQNILNNMRLLGNCSNKSVYSYTEEDKRKIFSTIDSELKRIKALYDKPTGKKEGFSLE